MKKNRIAVILVILLGSVSLWLTLTHKKKGTLKDNPFAFAVEDTASITKIHMTTKAQKDVTLERKNKGEWTVNGRHLARVDAMNVLLETINKISIRDVASKAAHDNLMRDFASTSIKVELFSGGKRIRLYFVGNDNPDNTGTYMLLGDAETGEIANDPYMMEIPGFIGYLSVRYLVDEGEWRSRVIFRYVPTEIKSITMEDKRNPDSSFVITLVNDHRFSVTRLGGMPLEKCDTLRVKQYISYFTNIQYEGIDDKITDTRKDSILRAGPRFAITVKDVTGNENRIVMYAKPPRAGQVDGHTKQPAKEDLDRMYGIINADKQFYIVQYWVFGNLLVSHSYFMPAISPLKK